MPFLTAHRFIHGDTGNFDSALGKPVSGGNIPVLG